MITSFISIRAIRQILSFENYITQYFEFGWQHFPSQDDFENIKIGYILTDNKEIHIRYGSNILDMIMHCISHALIPK